MYIMYLCALFFIIKINWYFTVISRNTYTFYIYIVIVNTFHKKIGYYCKICFNNLIFTNVGKQNVDEFTKNHTFNLPTKTFIDNYMKSFQNDPFNDEFPQTLIKSDVK